MDQISWAGVVIAIIGVVSAWLSGRSARAAAKYNSDAAMASTKAQAETEAYARARKMDIETIQRQEAEIAQIRKNNEELRQKVRTLIADNESLHEENNALRRRVTRLEQHQQGELSE